MMSVQFFLCRQIFIYQLPTLKVISRLSSVENNNEFFAFEAKLILDILDFDLGRFSVRGHLQLGADDQCAIIAVELASAQLTPVGGLAKRNPPNHLHCGTDLDAAGYAFG
jgi:hypothetical protein